MKNNILKIVLIFVCAFVLSLSSFFITTENEVYEYEIFAIGVYDADFGYNKVSFTDKNDFNNFLNKILTKSMYSRNIVSENDKIITLSTCSYEYDNARIAIFAVLK